MSSSPRSPKLFKGGIVLMDSSRGAVLSVIALRYNPHSLTRSLQAQWYEPQKERDQAERLQIKGLYLQEGTYCGMSQRRVA